jgi:hypothetical protein
MGRHIEMRIVRSIFPAGVMLVWAVLLSSCQTTRIADADPAALQAAAALKVETVALMAKAGEPFAQHRTEVEAVNARMATAYELAASTPNNELVAREWAVMRDPERDLYGGFVKRWQANGTIGRAFREEAAAQVAEGFDYIICLEQTKRSGAACATGVAQ